MGEKRGQEKKNHREDLESAIQVSSRAQRRERNYRKHMSVRQRGVEEVQ